MLKIRRSRDANNEPRKTAKKLLSRFLKKNSTARWFSKISRYPPPIIDKSKFSKKKVFKHHKWEQRKFKCRNRVNESKFSSSRRIRRRRRRRKTSREPSGKAVWWARICACVAPTKLCYQQFELWPLVSSSTRFGGPSSNMDEWWQSASVIGEFYYKKPPLADDPRDFPPKFVSISRRETLRCVNFNWSEIDKSFLMIFQKCEAKNF